MVFHDEGESLIRKLLLRFDVGLFDEVGELLCGRELRFEGGSAVVVEIQGDT